MGVYTVNQTDGSLVRVAGGMLYADAPIGAIQSYGGETAPAGWLICDGSTLSRTDYTELFAVIGINFDEGDGETTFGIPDLRECVPVGAGKNITQSIANHDRYNLGQFKDDQVQDIGKMKAQATSGYSLASGGVAGYINANSALRTGETTHGKQLGVNYIIKAKQIAVPFDVAEYVRNQNVLSEYEVINLSSAVTAQYDGYLAVKAVGGAKEIYINGSPVATAAPSSSSMDASGSVAFRKGDVLSVSSYYANSCKACYYKLRDYSGR